MNISRLMKIIAGVKFNDAIGIVGSVAEWAPDASVKVER